MNWLLMRLARDLGVEPARAGEALTPSLRYENPWPQSVTLLVLALSIGFIIWIYRREGPAPAWYRALLASLRISLVLLTLFILFEAVLSIDRVGLPYFVVMLDDSASMSRVDPYDDDETVRKLESLAPTGSAEELSRLSIARNWLAQQNAAPLRGLLDGNKLRIYRVSANGQSIAELSRPEQLERTLESIREVQPRGAQSRLGAGVRQVLTELQGAPPTGILLLTDGQTTEGESLPDVAELAERKGVPLYFVGVGDAAPPRDLVLSDLVVDEVVFVNDPVRFQLRLGGRGYAGQEVQVRLRELPPGVTDPAQGREVASIPARLPEDGQTVAVELDHTPDQVGDLTYVVEVANLPREERSDNNVLQRVVQVREDRLKVLLVDGRPRYEFRYLKSFLERRPETIELGVVLQSADPEFSSQDRAALPAFPTTGEGDDGLFRYDVVVLGDVDPAFLSASQIELLSQFVTERGGGLIFVAGEYFNPLNYRGTPLESLLPILLDGARDPASSGQGIAPFRFQFTAEGQSNPIFRFDEDEARNAEIWESLPEHYWYFDAPRPKPAAFVLAELRPEGNADTVSPLLLYQFIGAGKTMFLAVDDTWRWRLGVGDRYFGRFWIQSIRFMARSRLQADRDAELTTDRRVYRDQQVVQVRARYAQADRVGAARQASVELSGPSGLKRTLKLQATSDTPPRFETVIPPLPPGEYSLRLLPPPAMASYPTTAFRVEAPASETERIQLNVNDLTLAASRTGGQLFAPTATPEEVLGSLPAPKQVPLDADPPIPLWTDWRLLTLFLGILTTEWVLRKRKQMV